jgi:hypothetical protein
LSFGNVAFLRKKNFSPILLYFVTCTYVVVGASADFFCKSFATSQFFDSQENGIFLSSWLSNLPNSLEAIFFHSALQKLGRFKDNKNMFFALRNDQAFIVSDVQLASSLFRKQVNAAHIPRSEV